jgi:hypothetical protein
VESSFLYTIRASRDALRREACGHGAGVGVEGYSVEIVGDYFGFAKDHGCPVTGADELDASVRRAGQIVGNYSDQHFSTSARRLAGGLSARYALRASLVS